MKHARGNSFQLLTDCEVYQMGFMRFPLVSIIFTWLEQKLTCISIYARNKAGTTIEAEQEKSRIQSHFFF